jgi:hypothetical protein
LLFGLPTSAWQISADWDAQRPFLCAALPRALVDGLAAALATRGIRVLGIVPQTINTWNGLRGELHAGDWLAVVAQNTVTVVRAGGRRWWSGLQPDVIRVLALPSATSSATSSAQGENTAWLARALAREAMQLDLQPPQRVVLCGQPLPAAAVNPTNAVASNRQAATAIRFDRVAGQAAARHGAA